MHTSSNLTPTEDEIINAGYDYQSTLTEVLDSYDGIFTQDTINQIVLWKVNRFAQVGGETLALLNQIQKADTQINVELTKELLSRLLNKDQKGVRLAMASTILRFRNPHLYQIIDQRVYRFIYGEEMNVTALSIEDQIELYLAYLVRLREVSQQQGVAFDKADRVYYLMDKTHNAGRPIKY